CAPARTASCSRTEGGGRGRRRAWRRSSSRSCWADGVPPSARAGAAELTRPLRPLCGHLPRERGRGWGLRRAVRLAGPFRVTAARLLPMLPKPLQRDPKVGSRTCAPATGAGAGWGGLGAVLRKPGKPLHHAAARRGHPPELARGEGATTVKSL